MTEGKMDDFDGHRPTPWVYLEDCADGEMFGCGVGDKVGHDFVWFEGNPTQDEPTARLIAAAPDLLAERDRLRAENERLREALTWVRDEQGHCSECGAMAKGPCGGMLACDCPSGKHWQHDPIHIALAALAQEPTP